MLLLLDDYRRVVAPFLSLEVALQGHVLLLLLLLDDYRRVGPLSYRWRWHYRQGHVLLLLLLLDDVG